MVNGAVEANETLLQAAERELREETGPDLHARILGVFHAHTYRYDERVTHMTDLMFVARYGGGEAIAGDDVSGSTPEWIAADELAVGAAGPTIPAQGWLFSAAAGAARAWRDRDVDLDPHV